jgi:hypothetical protein
MNEVALKDLQRRAMLCRELHREAGGRSFGNVAQQFLNLRWPAQAHWLLQQLKLNDVIECVDRGIKRTSSLWTNRLPHFN